MTNTCNNCGHDRDSHDFDDRYQLANCPVCYECPDDPEVVIPCDYYTDGSEVFALVDVVRAKAKYEGKHLVAVGRVLNTNERRTHGITPGGIPAPSKREGLVQALPETTHAIGPVPSPLHPTPRI